MRQLEARSLQLLTPTRLISGATTAVMDQHDREFVPHVLPVYVDARVSFPNRDNIRHHVYSFSSPKKFELPLYIGTPASPVASTSPAWWRPYEARVWQPRLRGETEKTGKPLTAAGGEPAR